MALPQPGTSGGPEEPDPAADLASARLMGQRASRGAASVLLSSGIINIVQLASSLVLARALSPQEYGAFAVAATVVGFGRFLGDCGAGSAVIQQRGRSEPDRAELGRVFVLQAGVGSVAAIGLVLAAPAIRGLFDAPAETTTIITVLALTLVLEAPAVVPKVRLNRAQRYQRLQIVALVSALALYAVQIGGLLAGFGLYALVAGQVVTSLVSTGLLLGFGGGVVRPVLRGAADLARRGLPYQGALTIQALFAIASVGVVGTQLTTAELGLWTWCTVLATPLLALAANLQNIAFPALSRLHEHHVERHTEAVAMVARLQLLAVSAVVGVLCGLTVPLVDDLFDERWLGAVGAARAALLGVLPFLLAALLAATVQSTGHPELRLRAMGISTATGVVSAVPLAAAFGTTGAAVAIYLLVPLVDAVLLARWVGIGLWRAYVNAVVVGGGSFLAAAAVAPRIDGLPSLLMIGAAVGLVGVALVPLTDRRALLVGWGALRGTVDR